MPNSDDFKARMPLPVSPQQAGYAGFVDWRRNFKFYQLASEAFPTTLSSEVQQARLFNIAGPEFTRYVQQSLTVTQTTTVEDILDHVEKSLKPQRFDLRNRMRLFDAKQSSSDAATFLQQLRSLYLETNYGDSINRDTLIRDIFIHGLRDEEARRLVHQEDLDSLTLEKCLSLVSSFETAASTLPGAAEEISCTALSLSAPRKQTVASQYQQPPSQYMCFGCGGRNHNRKDCPAWGQTCRICNKLNHFARVCNSKKRVADIAATLEDETAPVRVSAISERSSGRKKISATVNGSQPFKMLVDCGSDITVLREDLVHKLCLNSFLKSPKGAPTCLGANNNRLSFSGKISEALIEIDGKQLVDTIWVSKRLCDDAILGQSALNHFSEVTLKSNGHLPPLIVASLDGSKQKNSVQMNKKLTLNSRDGRNYNPLADRFPVFSMASGFVKDVEEISLFNGVDPRCPPIRAASRQYSPSQKQIIEAEISNLVSQGKIRPSHSAWRSQILVVPGVKPRMVIDYAPTINSVTPLDAYPMPLIDSVLASAAQYKIFSYIDLKSAFHQFPIKASDRQMTAFEAGGRLWEWTCIPFGLRNSPAAFSRALDNILGDLKGVVTYMDDVIIGGIDQEDHDTNLKEFLKRATERNLTLNPEKCIFGGRRLTFLGHIIENKCIRPDPSRTEALENEAFRKPRTLKQLQRLIGLLVYHSKWVPNFSEVMQPLYEAQNCSDLPLSQRCMKALNSVISSIKEAILHIPDPNIPLRLETDASGVAVGAVLSQSGRPVSFMSRRLTKAERNWSPAELEGYAVILAVRKFRHFLTRPFHIVSDQKGLVSALNSRSAVKNAKYARWKLELSEFDYFVEYRPGPLNVAADSFSRCSILQSSNQSNNFLTVKEWHSRLCHPGQQRLYQFLCKNNISIPNCQQWCKEVCENCETCAKVKPRWQRQTVVMNLIESTKPMQRWSIDFLVDKPPTVDGKSNILTVVDEYSRFVFAFATSDRSSKTVIQALEQLFMLCGPPESIHSDRGPEFFSQDIMRFFGEWGVRKTRTTAYNPRCNGQCERYNGVLWRTIQCILEERNVSLSNWAKVLPRALSSLRSLPCQATGVSPHERFFAFPRRHANLDFTLFEKESKLNPGNQVLLRNFTGGKNEPRGIPVNLISLDQSSGYATISRDNDGPTDTVNIRNLAPLPHPEESSLPVQEKLAEDSSAYPTPSKVPRGENENEPAFSRSGRPLIKPDKYGFP